MAKNKEPAPTPAAEAPAKTFQAFTIIRGPGGWSHITLDVAVDAAGNPTVTNVVATEPDIKAVAIEKLKISNFKYWSAQ